MWEALRDFRSQSDSFVVVFKSLACVYGATGRKDDFLDVCCTFDGQYISKSNGSVEKQKVDATRVGTLRELYELHSMNGSEQFAINNALRIFDNDKTI